MGKTRANVTARKTFEKDGHRWEEGKVYGILCESNGFKLGTESGVIGYTYLEMDGVLENFIVPKQFIL